MKISIIKVDDLKTLLRKRELFNRYKHILNSLIQENGKQNEKRQYENCIASLESNIPFTFKKTSLKNGFAEIHKKINDGLLTGIIYTILNDNSYEPTNNNYLGYKVEDLQRLFVHLKIENSKEIDQKQNLQIGYNQLFRKFSEKGHPFGDISLDTKWEIIGGNSKDIDAYKKAIVEQSKKPFPKWLKAIIISSFILLLVIVGYFASTTFFNNDGIIEATSSIDECPLKPEYTNNTRIVIFEFKQDPSTKNKNFAQKLYHKIKTIIERDSLGIEVSICKRFNNFETEYEARRSSKSFNTIAKNLHRRDQKLFVSYRSNGSKGSSSKVENFFDFKIKTQRSKNIDVHDGFDEQELNFITYYHIVTAIQHTHGFHSKKLGIKYIDEILLSDSLDISDAKLLNYRARFNFKTNGINKEVEDLKRVLALDSFNTQALYTMGNRAFFNDDPNCISYYRRFIEIVSYHCDVRGQLAKSLAYFNNDFQSAHDIVDGFNKTDCEDDSNYNLGKAELLLFEKKYNEAIGFLQEEYMSTESLSTAIKLTHAFYLDKNYQEAINTIKPIVDKPNHGYTDAEEYLALIYRKIGQRELAIESILSGGESTRSTAIISYLYLESNNLESALKYINKSIKKSREDVAFLYNQRRIINNRLGKHRYAKIDSLKILDKIDSEYFKLKKYDEFHPYFGFKKLYNKIDLDTDRPRSITK